MNKVFFTIGNETDRYNLVLDVLGTPIADKWFNELQKDYTFFETNRFTGFPNSPTLKEYAGKINECIDVINNYAPNTITAKAYDGMLAEQTNFLHKFFEVLHGGILSKSEFLINAPEPVQQALFQFNVLIHAYEKAHLKMPMITCTFNGPRHPLEDEDYNHFTHHLKFGYAYLNYCEVGKHLLEYYEDQDDMCGEENIRPLKYYKADFKLKLGKAMSQEEADDYISKFESWFESKKDFFDRLGIVKDKYRSLGLIPVAKLNLEESGLNNLTMEEIGVKLSPYNKIYSIRCLTHRH